MNFKKIFLLFLCFCLSFSIVGCKNDKTDISSNGNGSIDIDYGVSLSLLYCANDTYDPYTLITKSNAELCQLLYDPLFKVDNNFESIPVLAQTASQNGNIWTVALKSVNFTDGTPLTANDVIFSYNLAKNCARYSSQLSFVQSVTADGNNVIFELSVCDPYFTNVLDFPILKTDSNALYDEDSVLLPPIGTGRYILNPRQTGLLLNENYFGEKGGVASIRLKNAPDSESITHYVEMGAADIYYADTSEGSIARMSGKKVNINRNVLIYLGINDNDPLFKDVNMRYAVSSAISRDKIVSDVFFGNAVAATGPFHPSFKAVTGYQTSPTSSNTEISIENLKKIGYNKLNEETYFKNAVGNNLQVSLLINGDNAQKVAVAEKIVDQLKDVGIQVIVNAPDYNGYLSALQSGSFQLYLGETELDNNFDITQLVIPGGSCAFGKVQNAEDAVSIESVINEYHNGSASITNVITALQAQMPFIPICYRSGIVFYNEKITDEIQFSENDLFLSISRLSFNN